MSALPELLPFFHRQSIVFEGLEARAADAPRLRVFRAGPAPGAGGSPRHCLAVALPYCVEATPEIAPVVASCVP